MLLGLLDMKYSLHAKNTNKIYILPGYQTQPRGNPSLSSDVLSDPVGFGFTTAVVLFGVMFLRERWSLSWSELPRFLSQTPTPTLPVFVYCHLTPEIYKFRVTAECEASKEPKDESTCRFSHVNSDELRLHRSLP